MTEQKRVRRLDRLKALGETSARSAERAFALSVADAANAAARLSHIEGLVLTTAPLCATGTVAGLAAAAQLRALLVPAVELAEARLQLAVRARRDAEEQLAEAHARARQLGDTASRARRDERRAADQRELDALPPRAARLRP